MAYSDRFNKFVPSFILPHEGGKFEHDPDDPGGDTKWGIDASSHPGVNIAALSRDGALDIYWDEWEKENIETLPYPLGEIYFNCCVNSGIGEAHKILVRETLRRSPYPSSFLDDYDNVYKEIVANHPNREKFLKGWLQRNEDLRKLFGIAEAV